MEANVCTPGYGHKQASEKTIMKLQSCAYTRINWIWSCGYCRQAHIKYWYRMYAKRRWAAFGVITCLYYLLMCCVFFNSSTSSEDCNKSEIQHTRASMVTSSAYAPVRLERQARNSCLKIAKALYSSWEHGTVPLTPQAETIVFVLQPGLHHIPNMTLEKVLGCM